MKSVLIIGASRGLGLEFVRQYRNEGWLTLGTCRSPEQDALLSAVGATAIRLDVAEPDSFGSLEKALDGTRIDVCIYNAGVHGGRTDHVSAPTSEIFDRVMHTNVLGALATVPIVAPAIARSRGTLVLMSSRMGSISGMSGPTDVLYRASKAALNAVAKASALEWGPEGVTVLAMHPGWVKTDMGGANADIDPATSIAGMRRVIANASSADNGQFYDYSGHAIAW
jgi:NAD(P)-dependent dehydrogenase (short-subunit alcohol dehydrogenase family)